MNEKKIDVAYQILNDFTNDESKEWEKVYSNNILSNTFISSNPNEVPINGYITKGKNDNFVIVGLYDDRYYLEDQEYLSDYAYYLSFGTMSTNDDSVESFLSVTEADLRRGKNIPGKHNIKALYDYVSFKIMKGDSFLDNF